MDNNIIVFPKFEKLTSEIKGLKEKLCHLLNERDELRLVICRNIEAEYMVKLGTLEIALFKVQCKVLRLKRKLALIQQKINRQEPVDEKQIETVLDVEFAEYQKKLEAQVNKLNEAILRRDGEVLSDKETKELKSLYYSIVKHLHPDLNPDATEAEIELFHRAVEAYHRGDLLTMRVIAKSFVAEAEFEPSADTLKELASEKDTLNVMVQQVKRDIKNIKTTFPYNVRSLLEDEEELEERREDYQLAIAREQEIYESYKDRIATVLRR